MLVLSAALPRRPAVRVQRRRAAGFTLLELVVTVTIIAIIAAMAWPSMTALINSNRLAGATNELVTSLQLARMDAIRLNTTTTVCRSDNSTSCADGTLWNTWIVIADADRDGAVDDVLRVSTVAAPLEVRNSAAIKNARLSFRSDGRALASDGSLLKASLGVCLPVTKPEKNERRVEIAFGSRISTEQDNGGGKCDAPADPK